MAACGSFEDPDIVVDIRVLAIDGDPPEQLLDIDLNDPASTDILPQLVPSHVCAHVADPGNDRRIHWAMTLCDYADNGRCPDDQPQFPLANGVIDDPDTTVPEPEMCTDVMPNSDLLQVITYELMNDDLKGLDGEDYAIELRVGGEGGDPALDLFGVKLLRVSARFPADRVPNQNPAVDHFEMKFGDPDSLDFSDPVPMPLGRCIDQAAPLTVAAGPGIRVRITPVETPDARQFYPIPTITGDVHFFTEALTYQWTGTRGKFSSGNTGGPQDVDGNNPPLFTDWLPPRTQDIDGPTDVDLWIVQRDERLGSHFYETCLRVLP